MRWRRSSRAPLESLADTLQIRHPFDLRVFCEEIAAQRGRPMILQELAGPADPAMPCGIWLGTRQADLVFYAPGTPGILTAQIVLHEVAHMLLGHVSPEFEDACVANPKDVEQSADRLAWLITRTDHSLALPGSSVSVVEIMRNRADELRQVSEAQRQQDREIGIETDRLLTLLGRSAYADGQEREAETLAALILQRAARDETRATRPDRAAALARLNESFGHPLRRNRT